MVCHKQRGGSFLLEAAVVLLLLMGAAGSIAHFATVMTRARQQQWVRFQQAAQQDNVVERLQHVAPAQLEATAEQLMEDENYGRPHIEIETIDVNGVRGQHVVITPGTGDSQGAQRPAEFWRFDTAETDSDASGAGEEREADNV